MLGTFESGPTAKEAISSLTKEMYTQGSDSELAERVVFKKGDTLLRQDATADLPIDPSMVLYACASNDDPVCGGSGKPIEVSTGAASEPNNAVGPEACLMVHSVRCGTGTCIEWLAQDCAARLPYVCECEQVSPV